MSDGLSKRGTVGRMLGIVLGAICGLVGILIATNPLAVRSMTPDAASSVGGVMAFFGLVACGITTWTFHSLVDARKDYLNAHDKLLTEMTTDIDEDELLTIIVEEVDDLPDYKPRSYKARPEYLAAMANVKRELRDLTTIEKTSQAIIPTEDTMQIEDLLKAFLNTKVPQPAIPPPAVPTETPAPPAPAPPPTTPAANQKQPAPPEQPVEKPAKKPKEPKKPPAKPGVKSPEQIVKVTLTKPLPDWANYSYMYYCEPFILDDGTKISKFQIFTEVPEEEELRQITYSLKRLRGLPPWKSLETKAARCWITEIGRAETTEETIPIYVVNQSHRMARDLIRIVIKDHEANRLVDNANNRHISLLQEKLDKSTDDHNALIQRAENAEAMLEQEKATNTKLQKQVVAEHAKQADDSNHYTIKAVVAGCFFCGLLGFFICLGVIR